MSEKLFKALQAIDGKHYGKFKDIAGSYPWERFTLHVDDVQGSPSSGPSRMRLTISSSVSGFPDDTYSNDQRRTALADLIARRFWESSRTHMKNISFPRPGQEILERGSVRIFRNYIQVAFGMDLPAAGKNAAGKGATSSFKLLYQVAEESLIFASYKRSKLYKHIETAENAAYIRSRLNDLGLVSFIAKDSILPRRDDGAAPMTDAVPFTYPESFVMNAEVPNGPPIPGFGIRKGMTVIAGATGSGKTTLIRAIRAGVYDHIPGDGREYVITEGTAFMTKRADGRSADNVDASMFSKNGTVTSECIYGALSQSVTMSEAVEMGCSTLLADEDSSYCPVLCFDPVLREMVPEEEETIIPVTDVQLPFSVVAVSGSGAVLERADTIILMKGLSVKEVSVKKEPKVITSGTGPRYPVVRDLPELGCRENAVTVGKRPADVSDLMFVSDCSFLDSAVSFISKAGERMDGTVAVTEIFRNIEPSHDEIVLRPLDIVMVMNRLGAVRMIKRKNDNNAT
jgi:Predicted ATPase of the ABC class